MNRMGSRIALLLTILTGLASAQDAPQSALYRLKLQQPYKYLVESKSDMIQEVMGEQMNITSESTGSFVLTASAYAENGDTKITVKVESALIMVETPQGTQTLGGDMKDKTVALTLHPNGHMEDTDSSLNAFEPQQAGVIGQVLQMFPRLDREKISAGSSWTRDQSDTTGGGDRQIFLTGKATFEVKGTKNVKGRDCFEISMTGSMEINGTMSRGGMDLRITGERTRTGTIYYDAKEGLLVEMTYDEKGDQVITDTGGGSMKVNITSTESNKVEFIP